MKSIYVNSILLKSIVLLFLLTFFTFTSYAQKETIVRGLITDEEGVPLAGTTIKATNNTTNFAAGTFTDSSGLFQFLNLPTGGPYTFLITSVGYESQTFSGYTLKAGVTISLSVKLKSISHTLNPVVVTGYTTQRKKDLTGAVSIVNVADAKATPVASIDQALQGKVAGVTVVSSNQPGGGVAVRIRGLGTINNNDPLYIIDGIPVTGNINNLNPNDIESIQVLKDASSASIYGARASNGVVIITTRTAKAGQTQILYDGYTGVQQPYNLPTLLNAKEYGQLWFKALANAGQSPPKGNPYGTGEVPEIPEYLDAAKTTPSGNTNWFKVIFHPAIVQSHTLNFLNGTDKGSTAFNVGYYEQNGILKYASGFKRYSVRFNSDYNFFNRLKVGEFASVANTESQSVDDNEALGSAITSVFFADPILPVYDINHNFAGPPANMPIGGRSPLSALYSQRDNYNKQWRGLGKVFADLTIIKDLIASTDFAVDYTNNNSKNFTPTYAEGTQVNSVNSVSFSNYYSLNTIWTNTLDYKRKFKENNIEILAGTEYIHGFSETLGASSSVLPSNDLNIQQLNAGTSSVTNNGNGIR
jgi:TonB-linked SusC/RagA family outer membrane protein